MEFLGVAAEVLDPVFDLVFGTIGEVDGPNFGDVSAREGDDDLEKPVFDFRELGLGLEPFLNDGDKQRVEKGDVVLEDFYSFLPCHHYRVVAE